MEPYTEEIERIAADGFSVTVANSNSDVFDSSNTIVLTPDKFLKCPSVPELINLLTKRVKEPGGFHFGSKLLAVAVCCICSDGYTVNHHALNGITARDVRSIWGILETAKTSSSPALSRWLEECIADRTQEGYERKHVESVSRLERHGNRDIRRNRLRRCASVHQIGTVFSERYFGSADTVRDAMISDLKMLLAVQFVYGEPVRSIQSIGCPDLPPQAY